MAGNVLDGGFPPSPCEEASQAPVLDAERHLVLQSGRVFDLSRSRWDGPLDAEEFEWCRANDVPLAFDCAQIGWVTETCRDDSSEALLPEQQTIRPNTEAEATRLCAEIRAASSLVAAARTDEARAEAERSVLASIETMVRAFEAVHGVRSANSLHWALHSTLTREWARPERRAELDPIEFSFRAWLPEDAPVYRSMLDNPRLWQFLPEPFPSQLDEATARTLIELGSIEGRQETLAVEHEGHPVGQCLLRFDAQFAGVRAAEVAYWLAEEHWGKGWMPKILARFLLRSLRAHAVDVVYAWIHEDHAASVRVAEGCGLRRDRFPFEAELAAAMQKPRFRRYAFYRSEWPTLG